MARNWTIPTLARNFEQFVSKSAIPETATVAEVRQAFKDAVWNDAVKEQPAPKKSK
jgi:hypothetical protein